MNTVYIVYWMDGNDRCAEAFSELDDAENYERFIADRKPWLVAMPIRTRLFVRLMSGEAV